jgi:Domain of Unknown Function (DUF1543)
MVLLGCTPKGRHTEQHDIFFGIGGSIEDLIPEIIAFWPEAEAKIHIDAWREVNRVDGYSITVTERPIAAPHTAAPHTAAPHPTARPHTARPQTPALFFINLGGYKENQFDEAHYKMLVVADNIDGAKTTAKKDVFFNLTSLEDSLTNHNAISHIDDKYGIDIDDVFQVQDILPPGSKEKYLVSIRRGDWPQEPGDQPQAQPADSAKADDMHLGYFKI